jgi:hypothetical protein
MVEVAAKFDLAAALRDPASAFREPQDVVKQRDLSREVKLKVLRQWERDAVELSTAEYEGMGGGEESMLHRVKRAIDMLTVNDPNRRETGHR